MRPKRRRSQSMPSRAGPKNDASHSGVAGPAADARPDVAGTALPADAAGTAPTPGTAPTAGAAHADAVQDDAVQAERPVGAGPERSHSGGGRDDDRASGFDGPDPAERVHALEQQVAALGQALAGLEAPRPEGGSAVDERMKSLLRLAEVLSVRYNPFLEHEEADPFTQHEVEDLLPETPEQRLPPNAEVVPVEEDAWPHEETDPPEPAAAGREPRGEVHWVPEAPVQEPAAPPPAVPEPAPRDMSTAADPAPHGRRPSPKRAYWVLCWFERLAAECEPSAIHVFLDHYHRLGWIPSSEQPWMAEMAESVAARRDGMAWGDVGVSAVELARLHRRHLRFLDRLFRTGFRDDEADAWERQAGDSLGAD